MSIPEPELVPDDPERLPPARRRRARRLLAPLDANERAAFTDDLARRASPSFDFFLFSLLGGAIISLGLYFDQVALLVLGAILSPLMAPVVGISLGTVIGSLRFFSRSLAGFIIGSSLVFLTGALAGYATTIFPRAEYNLAHLHAQLSWINFILLAVGAILTNAAMARGGPDGRFPGAAAPSVALAYALYVPLAVAGFGLSSGVPDLWPDGLVIFVIYLAWGSLLGALTLALMGFRPLTLFGYTLGGAVMLVGVVLLAGLSGAGAAFTVPIALPTPIPSPTPTLTSTPTLTPTPVPPTPTFTPTPTLTPTLTPTPSLTPTPTPVYATIFAQLGGGAFVRDTPGGRTVGLLANGTLVQVLPEAQTVEGAPWVRIIAPGGLEGWIVQSLLVQGTATPPP